MRRGASAYERELKELLEATEGTCRRYRASLEPVGARAVERFAENPFLVVRAAGSFGFDLVALRREFAFPIEVKASHADRIPFTAASGRAAEQLESHRRAVDRVGLLALYAYRRLGLRSGDAWRLYTPSAPAGSGRVELLRRRLPAVDMTRTGNAVLRWENGMPLSRFLEVMNGLIEPRPSAGTS